MKTITISDPKTGLDHEAETYADFTRILWNLRGRTLGSASSDMETQMHLIGKVLDAVEANDIHTVQQLETVLGLEFDWEPAAPTEQLWAARVRYAADADDTIFPAATRQEAEVLLKHGLEAYSWLNAAIMTRDAGPWRVVETL